MRRCFPLAAVGLTCGLALLAAGFGPARGQDKYNPKIYGPSEEGLKALKRVRVPQGTQATLFAAEPLLANPVAFVFDEKGRLFVAETFRLHAGVTDNRNHFKARKTWLDEELACRTVADRVAMYEKLLGKEFATYTKDHDRVRLIEDTDGDGIADKATVFADGFNTAASGIGAGLLARGNKVWYTCIPDLWLLQDTKGTGKADVKKSLHTGYGVHTAYLGHDLHGLKMGPDGRLYFSIGDRGLHVETGGKVFAHPDCGAVLRCNPDGSNLEIYATGLRNPQELTFDQFGNLFTGDNNADGGDKARWVHVVEGGDSGWRIGYQEMTSPMRLGPWNSERIWDLPHANQPANVVPPCAHIGNGPSGLTYHPGVALLPERYKDHFFLCDFRGGSGNSGVLAFKVKPKGASFQVAAKPEEFAWSVLATDCDFGPDGGFYVSDWVDGWGKTGKGRIYKIGDPQKAKDPAVLEVKRLLAEGMAKRPRMELYQLLEHVDMRVRMEAQFELVERNEMELLIHATQDHGKLGTLHGIWGIGQLIRKAPINLAGVFAVFARVGAKDTDVRCQTIRVLGEMKTVGVPGLLLQHLKDAERRCRFEAALALGKFGKVEAVPAICDMLRDNADKDPYLRHAGVMALTWIGDREAILAAGKDPSPSVRLAALLALRRLQSVEVARFLHDAEPKLVLEAARAIIDEPIEGAQAQLAALGVRPGMPEPLLYRVINANFRAGQRSNALALAQMAGRADLPAALRVEALTCLKDWENPSSRDRIVGLWRPLKARPAADAADALRTNLGGIFTGPDKVRSEAAKVAARYGIKEVGPALFEIAADKTLAAPVRVETLRALLALNDSRVKEALQIALADNDPLVRTQGRRMLVKLEPAAALAELQKALDKGHWLDQQGAFEILGELKQPGTEDVLEAWLDKLLAKNVPAEVQLDLLEAAGKFGSAGILKKLAKYETARPKDNPFAPWTEALHGGNAANGRKIFLERSEVSCVRCHKVQGNGGEVGPDLTGIGSKQQRDYLLESLVLPDKQIAKGYETVVLTLIDGKVKSGILKSEDKKEVRLMTPEGAILIVPVVEIDTRARGPSAMPADLMKHLSRKELRDLVEFLAGLK